MEPAERRERRYGRDHDAESRYRGRAVFALLKDVELQKLVKKYSDYIRYPIKLEMEKSRMKGGNQGL